MTRPAFLVALVLPLVAACGDAPDPADYGGGKQGEIIAKCVARAESKTSEITREQAGKLCTCMTRGVTNAVKGQMAGRNVVMSGDASVRCAQEAGITID